MHSVAFAKEINYSCKDGFNQLNVSFDYTNQTVKIEKNSIFKFWLENNFIFWQSANGNQVYEYTFKKTFNQLSGQMSIKGHNLITSENNWYNYDCIVN